LESAFHHNLLQEWKIVSTAVTRVLLHSSPVEGLTGWETRLFLITYPPGADASNHSHPVVGIGFVIEGTMVSAFDDDPEETFTAGQSFMDPAGLHRVSRNGSQTQPLKFVIAYTAREGQPNTVWPGPER
jgi:quercetin dioxygenase-like cupin family protein